jgi:assimilatory nitrate reductase catalytic subunit
MFEEGRFFTPDRKARFVPVTPRAPENATSGDYPLALNTGRIRDHWHTMTRTAKSPRLMQHTFEPSAEFHPEDARRQNLDNGALVRLTSAFGTMVARVAVTPEQRRGCVFVPMHWSGEFAGEARINALVNPAVDPISGQPELKHTPVRAELHLPKWHVFVLSRREIEAPSSGGYWVRGRLERYFRMEFAFDERPESWRNWAQEQLKLAEAEIEWIAYRDPGAGRFRYAAVQNGRLEGCVFIAPDHKLVSRSWLSSLFAEEPLSPAARMSLLAGQPADARADIGPIVCSCHSVGRNQIVTEALKGAEDVETIGKRLKAGTNCGACRPEIAKLLQVKARDAQPA